MFIEQYFGLFNRDIERLTDLIDKPMPEELRTGLEDELRKIQELYRVLTGEDSKSVLHQMRAKLRWAKVRLEEEKDPAKRRTLEHELVQIQHSIRKEASRKKP
jgi:hypothetical protein